MVNKTSNNESLKNNTSNNNTLNNEAVNNETSISEVALLNKASLFDQELKALLEKDVQQSITSINELRNLLTKAPIIK